MKNIFVILIFTLLLASCGDTEVSVLQERAGLMYTPNSITPYTGIYVENWDGGAVRSKKLFRNGMETGDVTNWHENGQMSKLVETDDSGNYHSSVIEWYRNGQKSYVSIVNHVDKKRFWHAEYWYENGQMSKLVEKVWADNSDNYHGSEIEWYKNGQKMSEDNYSKGLRSGKGASWFENGQIKLTANFLNGKLDGLLQKWDSNGVILISTTYKEGIPVK